MPTSSLTTLACRLAAIRIDLRAMQRVQMALITRRGTPVYGAGHKIIGNVGEDGEFHPAGSGKTKGSGAAKKSASPKAATPRKTPDQKAAEHAAQIQQA